MCQICAIFNPQLSNCEYEGLTTLPGDAEPNNIAQPQGVVINESGDAAAGTGTTAAMTTGDYFFGSLSSGTESDWVEVNLTAGQTYTFAVVGVGALDDAANDTYLRLRDASGAQLAENDDGGPGRNSTITFTATTTGTYYVDVGSYVGTGLPVGDEGDYGLSMTLGSRASYDVTMGAGNLIRPNLSWAAAAGTGATVSWAIRSSGDDGNGFIAPSAAQVGAISDAMAYIDAISGLNFTQVNPGGTSNSATMLFGAYNSTTDGAGAYAYYPGSTSSSADAGDVWLNNNSVSQTSLPIGSFSYFVMLHEIGHAIGLAHPGDYNAAPGVSITYANNAQFIEDSHQYTVMSYFDESNTTTSLGSYPDTLLLFDILAIHQLYGADTSYHAGDTVYGFNATVGGAYDFTTNTDPFLTIWDGNGTDTLDVSGFSQNQLIDLRDGQFSNIGGFTANVSIAVGAVIENAVGGAGNDTITGNAADNTVTGGGGTDTFVLDKIARADAVITVIAGGVQVTTSLGTDTLLGVEFIQFSDELLDLSAPLPSTPTPGNDALGGTSGNDSVDLLAGNDSYFAGAGDDSIFGNTGNDTIHGGDNNDTLDGGTGLDELLGEAGDDTYLLNTSNPGDFVRFLDSSGVDVADFTGFGAAVSIDLRNPAMAVQTNDTTSVENAAPFRAIAELVGIENIIGTIHDDLIIGEGSSSGMDGGLGSDTLIGGFGDDVYMISSSNPGDFDRLLDADGHNDLGDFSGFNAAVSIDLRIPSVSVFTNDTDTAIGGTFRAIGELVGIENIKGTDFNDLIIGEGSASGLDGGLGSDTIIGGFGDDSYRLSVSDPGTVDRFLDGAGEDFVDFSGFDRAVFVDLTQPSTAARTNDTADASGSGTMRVIAEVVGIEKIAGTKYHDHLIGEGSSNVIDGGAGDDTLEGGGGHDRIDGGEGSDIFVFRDNFDRDTLSDFDALDDDEKIDFSDLSSITDFADLVANHMTQTGGHVTINAGGGHIVTLRNTDINDLMDGNDFIF